MHPTWGPSRLLTTKSSNESVVDANIVVLDERNVVQWQHWGGAWIELSAATPPTDATDNLFLNYNPGRYNGVIVLRPIAGGFDDFGSLPEQGGYTSPFYSATLEDLNDDGIYEVVSQVNTCDPNCAEGRIERTVFRWDGTVYIAE
jgi:hypothetical protein